MQEALSLVCVGELPDRWNEAVYVGTDEAVMERKTSELPRQEISEKIEMGVLLRPHRWVYLWGTCRPVGCGDVSTSRWAPGQEWDRISSPTPFGAVFSFLSWDGGGGGPVGHARSAAACWLPARQARGRRAPPRAGPCWSMPPHRRAFCGW